MREYDHKKLEKKWQTIWDKKKIYKTSPAGKNKMYVLDMFPYPSGEGLHVGHPRGYIATDVYSRMKRMQGYDVLHPMGWDAFGLPAENFAIKNKVHPRVAVEKNVKRFKQQLSIIGFDYDWSREINTTDPKYYKWTQWIFLQMYKKGLAYESNEPINWCPSCQTGLANEDVEENGTCERCGTKVEQKPMRQWVLKITAYADKMLADLDKLPKWPSGVKQAQRNWIGRDVDEKGNITYRMRDWVFSRQRYWGEPIPIIHCESCGVVPVPEKDLPVVLPEVKNYEPTGTGESPLAGIDNWVNTKCPKCKGLARRETNTMPQWAGSSWYYLRYIDPKNTKALVDKKKEKTWMNNGGVDVYVGGDHATRHLIYARFWHKFLYDIGVVSTEEPFPRLEFLGFILAEDGRKMSKRWKNVVNPDDMVIRFGADAFRLYEMFIGPFENTVSWSTDGVVGTRRFIERVWSTFDNIKLSSDKKNNKILHKTIKKISEDIENFKFNTAVSSLMIFMNEVGREGLSKKDFKVFLQILSPFAPHMTEELWSLLGEKKSIHLSSWPEYDKNLIEDFELKIAVQINGKVRGEIMIGVDDSEEDIKKMAISNESVAKYITGSEVKKIIYVKNKIINIVV
jgi:leucyl-tRNA synthetase